MKKLLIASIVLCSLLFSFNTVSADEIKDTETYNVVEKATEKRDLIIQQELERKDLIVYAFQQEAKRYNQMKDYFEEKMEDASSLQKKHYEIEEKMIDSILEFRNSVMEKIK
uniref:hypothetical protein n=1 Tax=uncultured Allobacillus sp. TaxID=1638025 RepID=UPI00259A82DA|nr:hypothetical protein [uncultured Allobacillus sp.]